MKMGGGTKRLAKKKKGLLMEYQSLKSQFTVYEYL